MSISSYLKNEGLTYKAFGQMIGVTGTTIYRYTTGERFPRRSILAKIENVTGGKLTYLDFSLAQDNDKPSKKLKNTKVE